MGILNLTPDSFYDGNTHNSIEHYIKRFNSIKNADIIDIGAESSRPGSKSINKNIEIERLKIINDINVSNKFLSIDSYKPDVIRYCLDNNYNMINDISGGGLEYENIDIAHSYDVPICIMHMQGNPFNMQNAPKYNNLIDDLLNFFEDRVNHCTKIGYSIDNLIIDPGIGFGKTIEDNYKIISNIYKFKRFGCKILIGLSRKSFLQISKDEPSERLMQSITMQVISILNGVNVIRTHDVNEMIKSIEIINKYKQANGNTRLHK
tara:strand:- start:58 stop:846 length:789 start_codon:yes stop_codon:yes gene_type:complete